MSYNLTLDKLKQNGNFRQIPMDRKDDGQIIDFSLNDYMGLASRADLQERFFSDENNRKLAMTASAARLLAADQKEFHRLEQRLSELYGKDVLLFNSGYHANTGLISALASEPSTLILADKLVHASIIDGMTLSRAPFKRWRHNDFGQLEQMLKREQGKWQRIMVIVESVYSMDGDRTDLDALTELKAQHPEVMLYVDEAHAFGVLGQKGLGLSRDHEKFGEIDVVMGTFGKACASTGAFAVLNKPLRDYAVNRSRSFIFSTALPPMSCAWTRFMVDTLTGMDSERAHLEALSRRLADALGHDEARYITPVVTGSAESALEASAMLLENGMKVLPIRTPTVPPGTERLRISLSAAMTAEQIDKLATALTAQK